jgi:hypothetical protein
MAQIFDQMAETAARILLRQGTVTRVTDLPAQLRQIDIETPVRRHLQAANLRPTSFVKTYWDPNRTGLD